MNLLSVPHGMWNLDRRTFLKGAAIAAAGFSMPRILRPGAARAKSGLPLAAPEGGPRTVDHTITSFFDLPMPKDVWEQRRLVGYGRVRSYHYPVTHEWDDIAGPDLYPNIPATNYLYAPGRWEADATGLTDLTIDTIGGVRSPASSEAKQGFLPFDLMGGLDAGVIGGTARFNAHQRYIDRKRAEELRYPMMFGYHGWEEETKATIVMDRAAAQKVLGITPAQMNSIASWWTSNRDAVEQAWWWWLLDEGGDTHVGGAGRLDVRYAFDTPMQMWLSDLDLFYDEATQLVTMTWDWVSMAGDMLFSRWISAALGISDRWETNSMSDLSVDLRIGPDSGDLRLNTGVDYMLIKQGHGDHWTFEPSLADVPNLVDEYRDESTYESTAEPYVGKEYGNGDPFNYTPAAWDLSEGETLTLDWHDTTERAGVTMTPTYIEPSPKAFPKQIHVRKDSIVFKGPLEMAQWSLQRQPGAWEKLADDAHPQGLLPWGQPYVTFAVVPDASSAKDFADARQLKPQPARDPYRAIPPYPEPTLPGTPGLAADQGRTLRVDLYSMLDVPMVDSRWKQYQANDYQRIESLEFPVSYRSSDYFPPEPTQVEPFGNRYSGMRLRATGRRLPGITIDKIGGGASPAGFLPRNLMGGLGDGVDGGTATITSHLIYGDRKREEIYRIPWYWGYYGWENFWDVELTMDPAATMKVLGISQAEFDDFGTWFETNREAVRTAWRQWFYREFSDAKAMPWFNYPIQIWAFLLDLESADSNGVVLKMTVLNEAVDVLIGRWFIQTFLPHTEGSWDDMYLNMTIGPDSTDVDLDGVLDWGLSGYGSRRAQKWWWEPFRGDNPYLAREYQVWSSSAAPYFGTDFTETPSNWDLKEGEQINVHFGGRADLKLIEVVPDPASFPEQIDMQADRISFTGPMDMTGWSKETFPQDWEATGGLAPFGLPQIGLEEV